MAAGGEVGRCRARRHRRPAAVLELGGQLVVGGGRHRRRGTPRRRRAAAAGSRRWPLEGVGLRTEQVGQAVARGRPPRRAPRRSIAREQVEVPRPIDGAVAEADVAPSAARRPGGSPRGRGRRRRCRRRGAGRRPPRRSWSATARAAVVERGLLLGVVGVGVEAQEVARPRRRRSRAVPSSPTPRGSHEMCRSARSSSSSKGAAARDEVVARRARAARVRGDAADALVSRRRDPGDGEVDRRAGRVGPVEGHGERGALAAAAAALPPQRRRVRTRRGGRARWSSCRSQRRRRRSWPSSWSPSAARHRPGHRRASSPLAAGGGERGAATARQRRTSPSSLARSGPLAMPQVDVRGVHPPGLEDGARRPSPTRRTSGPRPSRSPCSPRSSATTRSGSTTTSTTCRCPPTRPMFECWTTIAAHQPAHVADPPRPDGRLHAVPQPGAAGEDHLDHRRDLRRPPRLGHRRRLVRARVPGLRLRVPDAEGAHRHARARPSRS